MADLVIKKIDTRVHVLACPQGNIFAQLSNAWMITPRSWQQHNDTIVNPSFSLVSFNFTDRWYPAIWGSDTLPRSNLSLPSFKVLSEMACRVDEFNFGFNIAPTNLRYLITDKKRSFAHFVYGYLFCYALFFFFCFFFFAFRISQWLFVCPLEMIFLPSRRQRDHLKKNVGFYFHCPSCSYQYIKA